MQVGFGVWAIYKYSFPKIQELDAIESHVKVFEKDVAEMKTILSSEDLLEFSPKDQLKHGQVCENSCVGFFP